MHYLNYFFNSPYIVIYILFNVTGHVENWAKEHSRQLQDKREQQLWNKINIPVKLSDALIVKRYVESAGSNAGVFLLREGETLAHRDVQTVV